jgi:hypothetical protein
MASRRPETMAKRAREQAVKEKRERKTERKAAAAAARLAGDVAPTDEFGVEQDTDDDSSESAAGDVVASAETASTDAPAAE